MPKVGRCPWHLGTLKLPPAGFRECVLRVAYMDRGSAQAYALVQTPSLLRTVAQWKATEAPQWAESLRAIRL